MRFDFAARSDVGLVRRRNEDSWGAWPQNTRGEHEVPAGLFAVADGMGGHPGGEVASVLAVSAVIDLAPHVAPDPPTRLRQIFDEASRRIGDRGREEPRHRDMGTTLTAIALTGGSAWVGHIGDTRLYWIRGDQQLQITRDHTMVQDLVDSGALSPLLADHHPSSNVLTRCLGVCPEQIPDLLTRPLALEVGDRLLLASDGLVKAVRPARVPDLIAGLDAGKGVERLLEAALEGGAPDNVTIILITVLDPGPPHPSGLRFEDGQITDWVRD